MKNYINYIKQYSSLLKEGAVWQTTKEPIASVITETATEAEDSYVYEFYCYISIIVDLLKNYDITFVEGKGKFKHKFPQAASNKGGKPRFHALLSGKLEFQICAGTKIDCPIVSEENHPDISFQLATASDKPTETDLILIMDAKYKEGKNATLPKSEVYKFGTIIDLYDLRKGPSINIQFDKLKALNGNCLITNSKAYSKTTDVTLLKRYCIKEVEKFGPNLIFNVLG